MVIVKVTIAITFTDTIVIVMAVSFTDILTISVG
jgi:hypothetical protein